MQRPAIVVQCFLKVDTLRTLCDSLLSCEQRRDFDLIFWLDGLSGYRNAELNREKFIEVRKYVKAMEKFAQSEFASIRVRENERNLGTCGTCSAALDAVFASHDFVVFTEDDTVFARDALIWFRAMRRTGAFSMPDIWAISGESVFFDSKQNFVGAEFIDIARTFARDKGLWNKYVKHNFVPSTCFATTSAKWKEFGRTRGQPLGDVDVCNRCRDEVKYSLFPLVSRVKDVGMLHPDGYSVQVLSADRVTSVKNVYLMSDEIHSSATDRLDPDLFAGNQDLLYWQSSLMNGFADQVTTSSEDSYLLGRAREATRNQDWHMSLELWPQVKDSDELTVGEADTFMALALLKVGRISEAAKHIEAALKRRPEEGFTLSVKAYIAEAEEKTGLAEATWRRIESMTNIPEWLRLNAVTGIARCAVPAAHHSK